MLNGLKRLAALATAALLSELNISKGSLLVAAA